jgi:hypothetical protein
MAGKVLRRAGAALLAGLFLAATVAHGQTLAAIQSAENYGESPTLATDPTNNSHDFSNHAAGNLTGNDLSASLPSNSDSGDAELPAAPAPAIPASRSAPYAPITGRERVMWVVKGTLWPQHLAAGVITMGIATAEDAPPEDGPHWGGFGERFGIRLTGVATSGTMEAGFGALWGEDPRYFRVPEESFGGRVKNVIKMTFLARRRDGDYAPAYARFIAIPGSNFLSNAWRPDSAADPSDAVRRTFEGFAGHMASNAWNEFWPDAKRYIFHRGKQP